MTEAEQERAAIVAWLRESPPDWPWTGHDIADMIEAGMPPWYADAIGAGDHLKGEK